MLSTLGWFTVSSLRWISYHELCRVHLEFFWEYESYLVSGTDASDIVNLFPTPYIETRQGMERVRKYIRTLPLCVHRLLFPALSSCCIRCYRMRPSPASAAIIFVFEQRSRATVHHLNKNSITAIYQFWSISSCNPLETKPWHLVLVCLHLSFCLMELWYIPKISQRIHCWLLN